MTTQHDDAPPDPRTGVAVLAPDVDHGERAAALEAREASLAARENAVSARERLLQSQADALGAGERDLAAGRDRAYPLTLDYAIFAL